MPSGRRKGKRATTLLAGPVCSVLRVQILVDPACRFPCRLPLVPQSVSAHRHTFVWLPAAGCLRAVLAALHAHVSRGTVDWVPWQRGPCGRCPKCFAAGFCVALCNDQLHGLWLPFTARIVNKRLCFPVLVTSELICFIALYTNGLYF